MKPRVYIETTIPSFYFEKRTEAEMTARPSLDPGVVDRRSPAS